MGLELLHLLAVHAVASMDSLVIACWLDDLAVKMGQMVTVAAASFDEHLVGPVDEAFLSQHKMPIVNLLSSTLYKKKANENMVTLWRHSWIISKHLGRRLEWWPW